MKWVEHVTRLLRTITIYKSTCHCPWFVVIRGHLSFANCHEAIAYE